MMEPLVSVIVPCYNMEQCVGRALDSILINKYKNKQILLVDDGSTDNTLSILNEYRLKYPYIEVIHKTNGGVSSARNIGLDMAKGEYVMFMDPDDKVSNNFIDIAVKTIHEGNFDIVSFGYELPSGEKVIPLSYQYFSNGDILKNVFPHFCGITQASFENWQKGNGFDYREGAQVWKFILRKSIIDSYHLRFASHLKAGEDQMFISLFLLYASSIKSISDVLYYYMPLATGLYLQNINGTNVEQTLCNKFNLLHERIKLAYIYKEKSGKGNCDWLYIGSCLMSCFQIAALFSRSLSKYQLFREYVNYPDVRNCIGKLNVKLCYRVG